MSIVNSRKRHQLRQQYEHGQTVMAQVKASGNEAPVAVGSDEKRPWADVTFMRTLRRYLKRQRALDDNGVKSKPVVGETDTKQA